MKVTLDYSENIHFTAKARHFDNIHIDEPESFHGTDLGPSAVEYILIGIGGCLSSSFIFCLRKNGIEVEELEIVVDGKMTHQEPENRLRLVKVHVDINFKTKNTQSNEKIERCISIFKEYCVVSNSIIQGIPITHKVKKKE